MDTFQVLLLAGVLVGALGTAHALLRDCVRLTWLVKLLSEGRQDEARAFVAQRPGLARLLRERGVRM